MADEQTVLDTEEVAPATPDTKDVDVREGDDAPEDDDRDLDLAALLDDDEPEGDEPEAVEIDFGGNKLSLPRSVEGLTQEDYDALVGKTGDFAKNVWSETTKRSEAVAAQAKEVQSREQAIGRIQALEGEALQKYATGLQLQQQLTQLQQIDLDRLIDEDPEQASRVQLQIAKAERAYNQAIADINRAEADSREAQEKELSRRIEAGRAAVLKDIPRLDERALVAYAVEQGYPREIAEKWPLDPVAAKFAHKAMLFDKLQAKARKQQRASRTEPAPIRQVARRGSRPASSTPQDRDSTEAWMRKRNQQLGKTV